MFASSSLLLPSDLFFMVSRKESNLRHSGSWQSLSPHRAWAFFVVPLLAVLQDLSKTVDDAKLSGAVGTLEGRHPEGPVRVSRLEKLAHANLMGFNKARDKVLQVGWGNYQYQYRLGEEWIESNPVEKDLGVQVDEMVDGTWQYVLIAQKANWVASRIAWPAV